jgi:hypothetical protein
MPWKRAKAELPKIMPAWWDKSEAEMSPSEMQQWRVWRREHPAKPPDTALFDACFRIQREASEAAGRYIPLIVENVKGAQPWVGRAKAHYGSFYLWGDVESVGGRIVASGPTRFGMPYAAALNRGARKNDGGSWFAIGSPGQRVTGQNPDGRKVPGMNFHEHEKTGKPGRSFQSAAVEHAKELPDSLGEEAHAQTGRKRPCSSARKAASALIAKIPFPLAQHIANVYKPKSEREKRASGKETVGCVPAGNDPEI